MIRHLNLMAAAAAVSFVIPAAQASTGPLPVRMEVAPDLRYHTIFRPAALPAKGALPVVVFAGGGCRNAGARFRELLSEVASHGYYVIALGEIGEPEWDANLKNEPRYNGRPTKTDVSQIDWAVDWAKAQTARKGSKLFGKLDTSRVALMGQSCGGVQVTDAASRLKGITTLVVLNSGLFSDDRQMGGSEVKRADLPKLTLPTMILLGGKEDIAYDNGQANFDLLTGAPTFLASADYGHRATYFEKDGGLFGTVVRDWLAWRIKGDAAAAKRFTGPDCGLCKDKEWAVRQRGL
ncbi:MAG: hypothetical protein ACKOUT_12030 [Novosphingobium sp.]